MSFCSLLTRRFISLNSTLFRYATVTKDGSYNQEKETAGKSSKWNCVSPAFEESVSAAHRFYLAKEERISDPEDAQIRALDIFNRMAQSLSDRGFSREMRPYQPREDVVQCIKDIYLSYFTPTSGNDDEWLNQSLDDMYIKFKFLNECDKQLDHEIPSPDLHLIKKVGDVVDFYKTPIRGLTPYDDLAQRQNELPPNLHVINQYIRFNPESDTFFDGRDAFPKKPMIVTGIRGKQKYEDIKVPFDWPDV